MIYNKADCKWVLLQYQKVKYFHQNHYDRYDKGSIMHINVQSVVSCKKGANINVVRLSDGTELVISQKSYNKFMGIKDGLYKKTVKYIKSWYNDAESDL